MLALGELRKASKTNTTPVFFNTTTDCRLLFFGAAPLPAQPPTHARTLYATPPMCVEA